MFTRHVTDFAFFIAFFCFSQNLLSQVYHSYNFLSICSIKYFLVHNISYIPTILHSYTFFKCFFDVQDQLTSLKHLGSLRISFVTYSIYYLLRFTHFALSLARFPAFHCFCSGHSQKQTIPGQCKTNASFLKPLYRRNGMAAYFAFPPHRFYSCSSA